MANLIAPDKDKHKYIVGIDFGHGETSAAICPIDLPEDAQYRELSVTDIDLERTAGRKVITSAICYVNDGIRIGDDAFDYMARNNGIRIGFKKKPETLDGEAERLMIDFMRAVYCRIRESRDELDETNHIVYIARPSGWTDEKTKELYRQMAIQAGIPLAGLTSESRAAIFYAKSPSFNFAKEFSAGAIVFDLGSSTLDFTYLSDTEKPIDFGYDLGASKIDEAVLENMVLTDGKIKEFVVKSPAYLDALKFKARKFKEEAYSRNADSKTVVEFSLENVIADSEVSDEAYADCHVKLRVSNLAELNDKVNSATSYMDKLKQAIEDYKTTRIAGKKVTGVFLTGGASRMNFVREVVAQAFNLPPDKVKADNDNPSLTISRGIALLGAIDATTSIRVAQFKKSLPKLFENEDVIVKLKKLLLAEVTNLQNVKKTFQLIDSFRTSKQNKSSEELFSGNEALKNFRDKLSDNIACEAWNAIISACSRWGMSGKTTDELKLEKFVLDYLKTSLQALLTPSINKTLQEFLPTFSEDIKNELNVIISYYAPGREIVHINGFSDENIQTIRKSLSGVCVAIINIFCSASKDLPNTILEVLNKVSLIRSDETKRRAAANRILDKKDELLNKIRSHIKANLDRSTAFNDALSTALKDYFTELIDANLAQVVISIE